MKIMRTALLALMALMTLPQLVSAAVIRYDYTFLGNGVFGEGSPREYMEGYGSFVVDTNLRVTTVFSLHDDAGQYRYEWTGAEPFREFQYSSSLGWVHGGIGTYSADSFAIDTWLWLRGDAELGDPFKNLTNHIYYEDFWSILDFERDGGWSLQVKINDAHVVPEPATLSLFALGLAAIGIRRRVTARLR